MSYPKPKVGDTVFVVRRGYRASDPVTTGNKPVVRVGRKYFTVGEGWEKAEICRDTWSEKTDYTSHISVYPTERQYLEETEAHALERSIKARVNVLGALRLTLDQLRRINAVLFESQP